MSFELRTHVPKGLAKENQPPSKMTLEQRVRQWRGTARYQRMRRDFLQENPLCALCQASGLIVGATELDHIKPVMKGGLFWDRRNLQGLCSDHHRKKTAEEQTTKIRFCIHGYAVNECPRCLGR